MTSNKSITATFTLISTSKSQPTSTGDTVSSPVSNSGGGGITPSQQNTSGGGGISTTISTIPTDTTQPTIPTNTAEISTISLGQESPDILKLQKFLNTAGFKVSTSGNGSPGRESTYFGNLTRIALQKFQTARGIPATGVLDTATRAFVGITTPTIPTDTTQPTIPTNSDTTSFTRDLRLGSTGSDVLTLQKFLNASGFQVASSGNGSPGSESDYFGPATVRALASYQRSKGIVPAVGFFGRLTRASVEGR